MKANELRIGNYVYLENEVQEITSRSLYHFDKNGLKIEPITLTKEWLLKFGSIENSGNLFYSRFKFILKKEYNYWYVLSTESGGCYLTKIEFVHEFQNLIFLLNGVELTIKI